MIIKNLILNFYNLLNNYYMLYSILNLFIVCIFLKNNSIRIKFFLFLCLSVSLIAWGFFYFLDGFFLLILNMELSIILYCLVLYTQVFKKLINLKNKNKYIHIFTLIISFLIFLNFEKKYLYLYFNYTDFYLSTNSIISLDFFILYKFFFFENLFLIIFFTIFLSLFSFYFIIIYYLLKNMNSITLKKSKKLDFLRKQSLINQSNYTLTIRIFQKK